MTCPVFWYGFEAQYLALSPTAGFSMRFHGECVRGELEVTLAAEKVAPWMKSTVCLCRTKKLIDEPHENVASKGTLTTQLVPLR